MFDGLEGSVKEVVMWYCDFGKWFVLLKVVLEEVMLLVWYVWMVKLLNGM